MKITKKLKKEVLSLYRNINKAGSFVSASKLRNSLGEKVPLKTIEKILSTDQSYVSHKRNLKRFYRRKFISPGV